jgi:BirA family biotin operon repressor/biotin-[acetyl-CoA-carboxylase] ligase
MAQQVLETLSRWRGVHARAGFAPVRAAFLARAPALGTPITLRLGERDLEGVFAGLGEDGSLLLDTGGRVLGFAAGEVTIGNLA